MISIENTNQKDIQELKRKVQELEIEYQGLVKYKQQENTAERKEEQRENVS